MAMKDWKKIVEEKHYTGRTDRIIFSNVDELTTIHITLVPIYKYSVEIFGGVSSKLLKEHKVFDTKKQALSYVRAYMRSH